MKFGKLFLLSLLFLLNLSAHSVNFESSNLPILVVDTEGQEIVDEPKINASLGIIDNGSGNRNYLIDNFNGYFGRIGIEFRGNSSQEWPKKPYGFETRDNQGENLNVSLLSMPAENDWVLYAPYVDKTLMRNVLIYKIARELDWYAPRTRFCELVINGEYMGVYVLIEKIKVDLNRVQLTEPDATDISGGYLLEMTKENRIQMGSEVYFETEISQKPIVIKYPREKDLMYSQFNWIKTYINNFETALQSENYSDPETGYRQYVDMETLINHMLISETVKQYDYFIASTYMIKEKGEKLKFGPVWDFNRCIGNIRWYSAWETTEWWLLDFSQGYRIFWPGRLMQDEYFMEQYRIGWTNLRQKQFNLDSIFDQIDIWADLLDEAKDRNFQRWPVLNENIGHKYVFGTYEGEIDYMKQWLTDRFVWMDGQLLNPFSIDVPNIEFPEDDTLHIPQAVFDGWFSTSVYSIHELFSPVSDSLNHFNYFQDTTGVYLMADPDWNGADQLFVRASDGLNRVNTDTFECHVTPVNDQPGAFDLIEPVDGFVYSVSADTIIFVWQASEDYDVTNGDSITYQLYLKKGDEIVDSVFVFADTSYIFMDLSTLQEDPSSWRVKAMDTESTSIWSSSENRFTIGTSTGIAEGKKSPDVFKLNQNYPNPFNSTTSISYFLPKNGDILLSIFNITGAEVAVLTNGYRSAGLHKVDWNGTDMMGNHVGSGIYFCRLQTENSASIFKMILSQ